MVSLLVIFAFLAYALESSFGFVVGARASNDSYIGIIALTLGSQLALII